MVAYSPLRCLQQGAGELLGVLQHAVNPAQGEFPIALLGSLQHTLTGWARRLLRDNRTFVRGYFEHIYRNADPYAIAEDPDERNKRAASIAVLGARRFAEALEIGGGEGLLTEQLADHVDSLLMVDLSKRALQRAGERLEGKANIRLGRLDVVAEPLPGVFDLIVCSEVLVYVQVGELGLVRDKIIDGLRPGGSLLLVHSRSIHDDDSGLEYKDIGAKTIHRVFLDDPRMQVADDETYDMYRITLLRKPDREADW